MLGSDEGIRRNESESWPSERRLKFSMSEFSGGPHDCVDGGDCAS